MVLATRWPATLRWKPRQFQVRRAAVKIPPSRRHQRPLAELARWQPGGEEGKLLIQRGVPDLYPSAAGAVPQVPRRRAQPIGGFRTGPGGHLHDQSPAMGQGPERPVRSPPSNWKSRRSSTCSPISSIARWTTSASASPSRCCSSRTKTSSSRSSVLPGHRREPRPSGEAGLHHRRRAVPRGPSLAEERRVAHGGGLRAGRGLRRPDPGRHRRHHHLSRTPDHQGRRLLAGGSRRDGLQPGPATDLGGAATEGHAHMSAIFDAIQAIASGLCRHVLVFRTLVYATARMAASDAVIWRRQEQGRPRGGRLSAILPDALSPANIHGLYATAYFKKYGTPGEQLGAIAVKAGHGRVQPERHLQSPITIDDYMASREISSPLRLYDCDTHIDGATALMLSRRDLAKDRANRQSVSRAWAWPSAASASAAGQPGDSPVCRPTGSARCCGSQTDLSPARTSMSPSCYDGFSIRTRTVWLETMRLLQARRGGGFVEGGSRIGLDGELPLNTSGGQLSAGTASTAMATPSRPACSSGAGRASDRLEGRQGERGVQRRPGLRRAAVEDRLG